MSVHAGSIITVAGQNVIDRIQEAGLGDAKLPIETIREVGNREVVDKVPGEPDYTFTMNSFNVSVELMALLTGKVGASGATASAGAPGLTDPEGTEYDWLDCGFINILSPWTDPDTGSEGKIDAALIVPGFYPTRITYRFGATDNATQEVELGGGSYFYAENAGAFEDYKTGDGATKAFASSHPAIHYRKGGEDGSTFKSVFGVLVDGELLTEEIDYTVSGGAEHPGSTATVTFTTAPANGADIRFAYFSGDAQAFPQSVHASTLVLPGAVRGRNIKVFIEGERIGGIQTAELNASIEGEVERELGSEEVIGRTVNGTDANGTITIRSKNKSAFFDILQKVTGVSRKEVFGFFNLKTVDLQIRIENPKNPGQILKTLRVEDAQFQPPGTPARVNSPTDFAFGFESQNGSFKEVKGTP